MPSQLALVSLQIGTFLVFGEIVSLFWGTIAFRTRLVSLKAGTVLLFRGAIAFYRPFVPPDIATVLLFGRAIGF